MSETARLAVELWAEKRNGRTQIIVQVQGEDQVEVMSWPDGFDKIQSLGDQILIPLGDTTRL